jgi:hypothetical protein
LEASFGEILAGKRPGEDLRIDVECRTPEGYLSGTVFGSGVGVWQRTRHFRLGPEDMERLLRAFPRHGFFTMKELYGPAREEGELAITVLCTVALTIGEASRRVTQVDRGERSAELEALGRELLAVAAAAGRQGSSVNDLTAGLRDIADGRLPAELLTLTANHQGNEQAGEGWLLRLQGRHLSTQSYSPDEGYRAGRWILLPADESIALASLLHETAVADLPGNLHFEGYTDLKVVVLGAAKDVQARAFAGREPQADATARFARILDGLARLHRYAQDRGRPAGSRAGRDRLAP